MITNFNQYKDLKRAKKMVRELKNVLTGLQVCLNTLKEHKQYLVVMESMSVLSTSYKVTELQLKRCNEFIKDNGNEKD